MNRSWLTIGTLMLAAMVLILVSAGTGTLYISPLRMVSILVGGGDSIDATVIWTLRLPRVLLAALAGIALAVSGAVLQGVVRNPLASPDIIGVTSGGSMMAVLFITFLNDTVSIRYLPLFSFAGAVAVSCVIYGFTRKKGAVPLRIILIGFGVTALLDALRTILLIVGPIYRTGQAQVWMTGSVYGATWQDVYALLPWLAVWIIPVVLLIRALNIQALGEETPIGLGARLQAQRFSLITVSAALAGSAVAFVGGIGFVGLMAPHMARKMVGNRNEWVLPCSAIIGAILVMAADLIGRIIMPPLDSPAGVFTAVIGAPFFLVLLMRAAKKK